MLTISRLFFKAHLLYRAIRRKTHPVEKVIFHFFQSQITTVDFLKSVLNTSAPTHS